MNRLLPAVAVIAFATTACVLVVDDELVHAADDRVGAHHRLHFGNGTADDHSSVNRTIRIADGARVGALSSVNGSIRIGRDATVRSIESVNGMVRADDGLRVHGSIESVNGSVVLARGAEVGGSVESINGRIALSGARIGGRVESVNAGLDTGTASRIERGIHYRRSGSPFGDNHAGRPRVVIGADSVVGGELRFDRPVDLYVHRSARIGSVRGATPVTYDGDTPPG